MRAIESNVEGDGERALEITEHLSHVDTSYDNSKGNNLTDDRKPEVNRVNYCIDIAQRAQSTKAWNKHQSNPCKKVGRFLSLIWTIQVRIGQSDCWAASFLVRILTVLALDLDRLRPLRKVPSLIVSPIFQVKVYPLLLEKFPWSYHTGTCSSL